MKNKLNKLKQLGLFKDTTSLDNYNFANLFNVVNKGEKSYFNLSRTIFFNNEDISPDAVTAYEIGEGETWTNISYRFYGTVKLWWLLCRFNNIKNPFNELTPGKIILIPKDELKDTILEVIQTR